MSCGGSSISTRTADLFSCFRLKILGRYIVEELPEPLNLGFLLVRNRDAGRIENDFFGINRGAGADRQRAAP
jgi:hypothetical protein